MSEHKHLCRDCGAPLYSCSWCDKDHDHRITGRCDACWKKLGDFIAIEHADAYGIDLKAARHNPDDSLRHDYRPYALVGLGKTIELPHITWRDLPKRASDGSFLGCSNRAWIITQDEWDDYVARNASRQAEIDRQKREETERQAAENARRQERRAAANIVAVYKEVKPRGGEEGADGYHDFDLAINGTVVRMVQRDVFDVGCYSYPKRVEGTRAVLVEDSWTDTEKNAARWIAEFGQFHGIRM